MKHKKESYVKKKKIVNYIDNDETFLNALNTEVLDIYSCNNLNWVKKVYIV